MGTVVALAAQVGGAKLAEGLYSLRGKNLTVVAVSPIVGGKALRGSAGKMMRELGKEPSARAVATEYLRIIHGFVIDQEDIAYAESVRTLDDRMALARAVLDFAAAIRESRLAKAQ